jgi:phage FluMu gp28-like protein
MSELDKVIQFTTYQKAWRADHSRFKIGMFARQTGKTFTTSSEIVDARAG